MKQKSVNVHDFAMIPRAEIPRSSFKMEKTHKTAFSFSYLVPILCEEVLPGDTWKAHLTTVARTAVPIVPIMDNWHLEFFTFFVPNRLVWSNWVKFMGEQANPTDSISYTIPQTVSAAGGFAVSDLADYFGLPTVGQVAGANTISVNALPFRAYNLIWQQWFRDENLQQSSTFPVATGDGPDTYSTSYALAKRGKRHDYFTSALPWPQKGSTAVTLPLGTTAPIFTTGAGGSDVKVNNGNYTGVQSPTATALGIAVQWSGAYGAFGDANIFADLSQATAATINQLRQSFQIQKLLERDARGGTRYTEIIRSHFGVISPDARLQRPEYIGGGRTPIITNAVPQTAPTGLTGASTPMGTLAATGHAQGSTGFTYNSTEHGYIIMLASARADLTYQQGLRKMWSRSTRYDFYFPVFAMLGEQTILNKEIYADGSANDTAVFGYQERWAEYRYNPSQITGIFKSTSSGTIDYWHTAQKFTALPTLNATFIQDDALTQTQRNFAAGALSANQQLLCDFFFDITVARPMPMYSVPGLIDHF